MKIHSREIEGLYLLEPRVFEDERGYFFESFNHKKMMELTGDVHWVQDNEAGSEKRVFRGFHYQVPPYAQAKLVRVTAGKVLDIAIDIRPDSPTFGQCDSVILSDENKRQFFIPAGFAHGYLVLSDRAIFNYKCDNYYSPDHEGGINFQDANLDINWPLPPLDFKVSDKDKMLPVLGKHREFTHQK